MLPNQDLNKTIENYTYNLNNIIGKGAFSSVYLGKCNTTGEVVAIKVINLGSLTVETYQKLQYELSILKNLPPHPNIVKMYSLLQTVNNVYIITEHC
jgi:serine/threonine protein kinase